MRGRILAIDAKSGVLAGDDGKRYPFWADMVLNGVGRAGHEVDFHPATDQALEIYIVAPPNERNLAEPIRRRNWPAFYFSPRGRLARGEFWLFGYLPVLAAIVVLGWIPVIGWILAVAGQWSMVALSFKRFHDRSLSGWWSFLSFLPLAAGIAMLAYAFFAGDTDGYRVGAILSGIAIIVGVTQLFLVYLRQGISGPNKYGPDPLN